MHVEIGHRDAGEAPAIAGMVRGDGDIVEEAEAHRAVALGMMTGWADGGKGGLGLAFHHEIDGARRPTRRAESGLGAAGAHRRVGVERDAVALLGADREDAADMGRVMRGFELLDRGVRGGFAGEGGEFLGVQRLQDGAQTIGLFGVALPGVMLETGGVGDERDPHRARSGLLAGDGGFGGLEADLAMVPVAEGLGDRRTAAAQENAVLARDVIEIAVPVAQVELGEITRHQKGAVLGGDDFDCHGAVPSSSADGPIALRLSLPKPEARRPSTRSG
jgi:hypothetical protein